jgi:hypothetical protein
MLLRALRHRGAIKKVGRRLLRPVIWGVVAFVGALIVWKFLIGGLHMAGVVATPPGLRTQYLVPLIVGVCILTYRLIRDLLPDAAGHPDNE